MVLQSFLRAYWHVRTPLLFQDQQYCGFSAICCAVIQPQPRLILSRDSTATHSRTGSGCCLSEACGRFVAPLAWPRQRIRRPKVLPGSSRHNEED